MNAVAGQARRGRWVGFAAWALVGAAWSVVLIGALTIGVFVLPVAALLTFVVARRPWAEDAQQGIVSGLAPLVLYVAYLNRYGPGTHCTHRDGSTDCMEEWSPWPFLVAGLAFLVGGLVLFARRPTTR